MINLESEFSPRVNPADANYPFGSIKDNSSPGANDGTPLAAVWGNDWEGFAQAAMTEAGITPSGLPDTAQDSQLLAAVKVVASGALREELASHSGSDIVGFQQAGTGSFPRTAQDKMRERITPLDFSAAGDGVTNDQSAFNLLEAEFSGESVDLLGKAYVVDAIPSGNRYINGNFILGGQGRPAKYIYAKNFRNVVCSIGNSASSMPVDYDLPILNQFGYLNGSFAAGNALNSCTGAGATVAIGPEAMGNTIKSFSNIAIGEVALQNVQSNGDDYSSASSPNTNGTRNVAVGDNAMQFLVDGFSNVAIGRNAGVCSVSVSGQVAVGASAFGGNSASTWFEEIVNFTPNLSTTAFNVAVGTNTCQLYQGDQVTAVGYNAGKNLRKGTGNALFGFEAGLALESPLGRDGKTRTDIGGSFTYVKTGNNMVITVPGHGTVVGGYIQILPTSGPADVTHGHYFPELVLAVSGDDVTVNCPYAGDGSGDVSVAWTTTTTNGTMSNDNTALGVASLKSLATGSNNVAVGNRAIQNCPTAGDSTCVGTRSGQVALGLTRTSVLGIDSANGATAYTDCTGIGWRALKNFIDTSVPAALTNATSLGSNAQVSGSNQVQLGNSATTTYVYGTVQNRSDIRDKADIQDTQLGIDFIMGLRPVDGRWDLRDDYVSVDEEGNVTHLEKDGSKKRQRLHHWFIAQEVKELCDSLGVEFGGYQDHSVNGGCDVLSLGYDEFIPPAVKAIQQCWARLDELEKRIAKLE